MELILYIPPLIFPTSPEDIHEGLDGFLGRGPSRPFERVQPTFDPDLRPARQRGAIEADRLDRIAGKIGDFAEPAIGAGALEPLQARDLEAGLFQLPPGGESGKLDIGLRCLALRGTLS